MSAATHLTNLAIFGNGAPSTALGSQVQYVKNFMSGRTDAEALNAADAALTLGGELVLEAGKVYNTTVQVRFKNAQKITGVNSTIKPSVGVISSAASCVNWGNTLSPQFAGFTPFTLNAKDSSFTLPAGVTVTVGDMLFLRGKNANNAGYAADGSEAYVKSPSSPGTFSDYFHGMYTVVTAIIGSTVYISTPAYATFPVYSIIRYQGYQQMEMSGVTIDLRNTDATCVNYNEGLSVSGTNIDIHGCSIFGNEFGLVGLAIYGEKSRVVNCSIGGFLNIQGQGAGGLSGRIGYGIFNGTNNAKIWGNTLFNAKHAYSSGSHFAVTINAEIDGNLIYEDGSLTYTLVDPTAKMYQGSVDFHCGVFGKQRVVGNYIVGFDRLLTIRNKNGGITIERNTLITTSVATSGGIIAGSEVGFEGIVFDNNDVYFAAGSSLAVFGVGGTYGGSDYIDAIRNCDIINSRFYGVSGNNGGYLFNITRPTLIMENIRISGNSATNIKAFVNVIAGSAGAGATLTMKNWLMFDNLADGCDQVFNMNVETAASTQLVNIEIRKTRFFNAVNTTLHAINLATPNPNGRTTVINNLQLDDNIIEMNTAVVASTFNYCVFIALSLSNSRIAKNRLIRVTSVRALNMQTATFTNVKITENYLDTDLTIESASIGTPTYINNMQITLNDIRTLTFQETAADLRLLSLSVVDNSIAAFRYTPRLNTPAWVGNSSNDVRVANNVFYSTLTANVILAATANGGTSGAGHRFQFDNNSFLRGYSDLSGVFYGTPVGNFTANSSASLGVAITSVVTGTTTVFNVANMNNGASNQPFLQVGDIVVVTGLTGTSFALINGIALTVIGVVSGVSGSFTLDVVTTSTLTGGVYAREPHIWWKGNTVVNKRGNILSYAIPTTGTWKKSEEVIYTNPETNNYRGAIAITSGTPGTWKNFGALV